MDDMSQRKQISDARNGAAEDEKDVLLEETTKENTSAALGSLAATPLEQEQLEAREGAEQEQLEAREKAAAEAEAAKYFCGACGATLASKRCAGCATVRYCGEQCQVAHWPAHKARCRELKAGAAAAAAAPALAPMPVSAEAKVLQRKEEQGKAEQEVVHNADKEAGNCWTCGADNPRNVCKRCKVTKYCGVACQTENWPIHKGRCANLSQAAEVILRKAKDSASRSQEELDGDLCIASGLGRIGDIERIIAAGGMVNSHNVKVGALYMAAMEGHVRAIGLLVRHGAHIDAHTKMGQTACHVASQYGQVKAVAALLELGAQIDLDADGSTSLHVASFFNQPKVVALLLEKGAHVDRPSEDGTTSVIMAAQDGHTAVLRLLLKHGAKVNSRDMHGRSSLFMASQENHFEIVSLLLEAGAQVDLPSKDGVTPLGISSHNGHMSVVRLLLEHKAQINIRDNEATCPLYWASQNNHPEVVALLLQKGAQADMSNKTGITPLSISVKSGHVGVVRLLLEHGADIDARVATVDATALFVACQFNQPEVVALLLQKGAQVDLPATKGFTPLIISAFQGNTACVRLLLQAGADPLYKEHTGATSLDLANHPEIVALLQARIAELERERAALQRPSAVGP